LKTVLFIDRDGTIIEEPPEDFQVDSLEKLSFLPKAISSLRKIAQETEYELVMVTNQDGLGTDSFPEETFWPAHNKMIQTLEAEGVIFREVLIDRSFPADNLPTRKPGTGLLEHYLGQEYDLAGSYVIGDRPTDIELAKNLGAQAIYFNENEHEDAVLHTTDWEEVYAFLRLPHRKAAVMRKTKETSIEIKVDLDGSGETSISTGLGFFDHMLEQIGRHGGIDLHIEVNGDLAVDEHHTIEDTALVLGEAILKALGNKKGIYRYGFLLPMDDALAQVAIDFGGRPWLVWEADFQREKVGDMPTEMFYHFFKSFSDTSLSNLNIKAEGKNEHHKIEAIFKAFARAIKMAVKRDIHDLENLPSTKGTL
jgi:imidazoleglycerol-phosphate dehydratase/histidinol-phosphatase